MRILFVFVAVSASLCSAQSFNWLQFLTARPGSFAWGVSGDGRYAVGAAYANSANDFQAVRWDSSGAAQGLGYPFQRQASIARAVSADGSVLAGHGVDGDRGWRWIDGIGFDPIDVFPTGRFQHRVNGMSADGRSVVGHSPSGAADEAFRWTPETGIQTLGTLPGASRGYSEAFGISSDGGTIVGVATDAERSEAAFRWTADNGMEALGFLSQSRRRSTARAVSDDGSVIVGGSLIEGGEEAFCWTASGGMVGLGDLPGGAYASHAYAVSADGSVVVGEARDEDGFQAFIWTEVHGMRSLKQFLLDEYEVEIAGELHRATGISYDGLTIVGIGENQLGDPQGWIIKVPGIGTLTTMAAALLVPGRRRHGSSGRRGKSGSCRM